MNAVIIKLCRPNKRGVQYSIAHAEKAAVQRVGPNESGIEDRVVVIRSSLPEWSRMRYNSKMAGDALEAGCRSDRVKQKVKYLVISHNKDSDDGDVQKTIERADKLNQLWLKKWAPNSEYYYFVHADHAHIHSHVFVTNWDKVNGKAIDWRKKDLSYMQSLRWANKDMPDIRPGADLYEDGGHRSLTYTRDSEGVKEELAGRCMKYEDPAGFLNELKLDTYLTTAKNGHGGGQPGVWYKGVKVSLAGLNSLMRRNAGKWDVAKRKKPEGDAVYENVRPKGFRTWTQQQTVQDFRMGYWPRGKKPVEGMMLEEYDECADTPVVGSPNAARRTVCTELKRRTLGAKSPHPKSNGIAQYVHAPKTIPPQHKDGFVKVLDDLAKQLNAQNPEAYKRAVTLKEFSQAIADLMDAVEDLILPDELPQLQAGDIIVTTPHVEVPIVDTPYTPPPAEVEMDRAIQRALEEVPSLVPGRKDEEVTPPVVETKPKVSQRSSRPLPPLPPPDELPDL